MDVTIGSTRYTANETECVNTTGSSWTLSIHQLAAMEMRFEFFGQHVSTFNFSNLGGT